MCPMQEQPRTEQARVFLAWRSMTQQLCVLQPCADQVYGCASDCSCLQIKGTVLLMPNGSDLVTSAPLQTIQTDKKVSPLPSSKVSVPP
jgi:hypothetical protein